MIYVLFIIIIIIISSSCNSIIDILQKNLTNLHTKFPASLLTASNLRALYICICLYTCYYVTDQKVTVIIENYSYWTLLIKT